MSLRPARLSVVLVLLGSALLAGCERPPVAVVQRGYRGVGMDEVYNPRTVAEQVSANQIPVVAPALPGAGPKASTVYKNVKVLGDTDTTEFVGTMAAMTAWVSPTQGCTYCHDAANFASDALYTKVVARRMLQMTQHLNHDWKSHVANTGVTCYTCHRGQPVPSYVWFSNPGNNTALGDAGNRAGKNAPSTTAGLSSLPIDPLTTFLDEPTQIRVISQTALPEGNRQSIKQTEWTYALMIHMSKSLGVNCTYCHNSRAFTDWSQSTPQRGVAWYGIRMVRDLNTGYLDPLASTLPLNRHGPLGDGPKVNCTTCHQGAYKPLFGVSMVQDFPVLLAPTTSGEAIPPEPSEPSVTQADSPHSDLTAEAAVAVTTTAK